MKPPSRQTEDSLYKDRGLGPGRTPNLYRAWFDSMTVRHAPLAQRTRAAAFEAAGREFESLMGLQFNEQGNIMADRWMMAVKAAQTHDLMVLARLLANSVQEVLNEPGNVGPHMDPAVRLIAFQIAFAGNGDLSTPSYYEDVMKYCILKANNGPNADFPQENKDAKPPVCEAQ